jgi:hypothetical protein
MLYDNNIIKIVFKKNIIKNFNELYFKPNFDIVYYNNNHLNYIYKLTDNNLEYIFNGFFKDNYFTIIYDIYDKDLNTNIKGKYVFLIKLDWIFKEFKNNLILNVLDYSKINNLKTECIVLSCRKKLFVENISITDLFKICEVNKINIIIDLDNNINKKKFYHKFFDLIKF